MHQEDYFRSFYIRRALRIFPLFYGFWLLLLLLTPVLHVQWNRYLAAMVLYGGNFFLPGWRLGLHVAPSEIVYRPLSAPSRWQTLNVEHFWTLCVEEQFYLLWPALIHWIPDRKVLLRLCVIALAILPCIRLWQMHRHPELLHALGFYHITWFHLDSLLAGAAVALWLRSTSRSPDQIRRLGTTACLLPAFLLGLTIWITPGAHFTQGDRVVNSVGFLLMALSACGLLILAIDLRSVPARLLRIRPLTALGRISYGLYFFHMILLNVMRGPYILLHVHIPQELVLFLTTVLVAWLSFRFYESPFLRLKHVLAPRPGAVPNPAPAGTPIAPEAAF